MVGKEQRLQKVFDSYSVNPATLGYVVGKPNIAEPDIDPEHTAQVLGQIKGIISPPKKRYDFPQTEAQEVGWDYDQAQDVHASLLSTHRSQTELTKFADVLWKHEAATIEAQREAARAAK